jgi:hypothetical protein
MPARFATALPIASKSHRFSPFTWQDYEQVLGVEAGLLVIVDDLDVRKPLPIRANLVLALYDQHAIALENASGLSPRVTIERQHGIVIFGSLVCSRAIGIVVAKGFEFPSARKLTCFSPKETLHVRRVEHHAIE